MRIRTTYQHLLSASQDVSVRVYMSIGIAIKPDHQYPYLITRKGSIFLKVTISM